MRCWAEIVPGNGKYTGLQAIKPAGLSHYQLGICLYFTLVK